MKKLFLSLSFALTLAACSSADTTPAETEATVLPAEAGEPSLLSDDLMADADALPPPEGALSTPVEPPPAPELPPVPDVAETESTNTATDTATDATADSSTSAESEASASASSDSMPAPVEPSSSSQEALPPVVAGAGATKTDRNVYQDYREYQDRVKTRSQSEAELDARALFPHEDGAFQLGLDYIYKPFGDLDFDPGVAHTTNESQGGALSFNYFPLRSLSYGRLGVGGQVAAYWTKYTHTAGGVSDSNSKHSIDTYGARLIYEFQYFLGQTVVPHAFYAYDQVRVRPYSHAQSGTNYPGSRFSSQSYGGGAHLNLNRLESSAASKALATSGIRKFYLSYTFLQRAENTGSSHYLGLKFEY